MGNVGRATAVASALWASIAITMAVDGGFGDRSEVVFVTSSGFVLLAGLLALGPPPKLTPPAVVLILLGLLGCISSAWTVSDPESAIRTGAVTLSLAAVVVVSARLAAHRSPAAILTIGAPLAAIATICGLVGLYGVATGSVPFALRIEGVWRPAGPLEYPPALAMLEIMALPLLIRFCAAEKRVAATTAAFGLVVAVAVLVLAESRLGLVLGAATAGACVLAPVRAFNSRRGARVTTLAGALATAGALHLLVGGLADGRTGRGAGTAVATLAILLAGALIANRLGDLASTSLRPTANHRSSFWPAGVWAGLGCAAVAAVLVAAVATERAGPGVQGYAGPLHGRENQWQAAVDALVDRPLAGSGADSYYVATASEQGADVSLYAHSLPLEAGAELGAIGLALVIALYATTAIALWRGRREPGVWLVAPGVVGFLIFGLVDWQWHLLGAAASWAVLLGWLTQIAERPGSAASKF